MKRRILTALALSALLGAAVLFASLAQAAAPTVTIEPASPVGYLTAGVEGTVDPGGEATTYRFQYIAEAQFQENLANTLPGFEGASTGIEVAGLEGPGPQPVSGQLTGLAPATTYHLRLIAENGAAETGEAVAASTFTTKAVAKPTLTVADASAVEYTRAHLSGTVELAQNDPAFNSSCVFEYATEPDFSNAAAIACQPATVLASEAQPVAVTASLTGLAPSTTYHLRLVSTDAGGSTTVEAADPFTTQTPTAPTIALDPTTFTGTTAHLSATIDPNAPGAAPGQDPAFDTTYAFHCTPTCPGLTPGEVKADDTAHEVSADATGLVPNTTYEVTLTVQNLGGPAEAGPQPFTTLKVAPAVDSTSVSEVTAGAATLQAQIDPGGAATTYHFEYETQKQFEKLGAFSEPFSTPESASIGSDAVDHAASASITGLTPETTYRYRAVATNSVESVDGPATAFHTPATAASGTDNCPNAQFRTGAGANLPDCRAYELVSPANKNGGEIDGGTVLVTATAPSQAALDGEAVTYASSSAFAGAPTALPANQYLSRRTASGWTTQALDPAQEYEDGKYNASAGNVDMSLFQGFSEDLSHSYLVAAEPSPVTGAPAGYFNPYLRDDTGTGTYSLLSTATPPVQPRGQANVGRASIQEDGLIARFAGFSADAGHVIFQANDALTQATPDAPAPTPGEENLYEWSNGQLELVSVLPNGTAAPNDTDRIEGAEGRSLSFGSLLKEEAIGFSNNFSHAISADGSRVIWSSDGGVLGHAQVYLSEHGKPTVEVSKSRRGTTDPAGEQSSQYWTASADDSLIYFTSCQKLTDDSTAHPSPVVGPLGPGCFAYNHAGAISGYPIPYNGASLAFGEDLYQYNADTEELTDLTVDAEEASVEEPVSKSSIPIDGAEVTSVLGASEDGSYVYFAARGHLAPGAPPAGLANKLYLWHQGEPIRYIATLAADDETDLLASTKLRMSRVSPDGLDLAFQSTRSLTGYDNRAAASGECAAYPELQGFAIPARYAYESGRCIELYQYEASSHRLICASCNPTGARPTGNSQTPSAKPRLEVSNGWQAPTSQQRYLLDDGRLFFQSEDALVPGAGNGKLNVYEHEPDGVGTCHTAAGCLSLLSSGTSDSKSYFLDAGIDGKDAFIETASELVPADGDDAIDVYDAREGGGFAGQQIPSCAADACQGRPSVPPASPSVGSTNSSGPGSSEPPTKCRKGLVNKHGKCVKKHIKKKHHKHKGSNKKKSKKADKRDVNTNRGGAK